MSTALPVLKWSYYRIDGAKYWPTYKKRRHRINDDNFAECVENWTWFHADAESSNGTGNFDSEFCNYADTNMGDEDFDDPTMLDFEQNFKNDFINDMAIAPMESNESTLYDDEEGYWKNTRSINFWPKILWVKIFGLKKSFWA